jgi:hypothetical protein
LKNLNSISHVSLSKINYTIDTRKYVIPPTTIAEVFRNFGSSKHGSRTAVGLNNFEYNNNFEFYCKLKLKCLKCKNLSNLYKFKYQEGYHGIMEQQ